MDTEIRKNEKQDHVVRQGGVMPRHIEKVLRDKGVFRESNISIIENIVDSIYFDIPRKMKITLAINGIVLYASQFKKHIQHWDGTLVPVNAITFLLAPSGASKDSSHKIVKDCFRQGYDLITERIKENAINVAMIDAREAGKSNWDTFAGYNEFYIAPNPLFVAISTQEGFIQHLNMLEKFGLGAGFIYSGEFTTELMSNSSLSDNIKLLAELYDIGNKEIKILKDRTNQLKEIVGMPASALFISSYDNLLIDESLRKKFKIEFSTKLARRSFFAYCNDISPLNEILDYDEYVKTQMKKESKALEVSKKVKRYIKDLTIDIFSRTHKYLAITDEARSLFTLYKRYNEEESAEIPFQYQLAKLARQHNQWKTLKLAGALAIINNKDEIDADDYKDAISLTEYISSDMLEFEKDLQKEPYEMFVKYVNEYNTKEEIVFNVHNLKKSGFIDLKGQIDKKLDELVMFASSCDPVNVYKKLNNGISFKRCVTANKTALSYKYVSGTKESIIKNCDNGYEDFFSTFAELKEMLHESLVFSPFMFKNGKRSNLNIINPTNWVALDVNNGVITMEECHDKLSNTLKCNHHIATTNDPDNKLNYRILLHLNSTVDIHHEDWHKFLIFIKNKIGINISIYPKSQVFISYEGRNVLSALDKEAFNVREYYMSV